MHELTGPTRGLVSEARIAHVVYALLAFAPFTGGLTAIAAVVVNYIKLDDVTGTWLESHFRWQMRTFWWTLVWFIVGGIFFATIVGIPIGWMIHAAAFIWLVYRIVRGWLILGARKPIADI